LILRLFVLLAFVTPLVAKAEPVLLPSSSVVWDLPAPWFGGFSGAEVSEDGETLTVVTDKGNLVVAKMIRRAGKLSALQMLRKMAILTPKGAPLKRRDSDAEGLAIGAGGTGYISFEHNHRVMQFNVASARLSALPQHPDFAALPPNGGLEALALHPNGTLYTLPEQPADAKEVPIYAFRDKAWRRAGSLPRRGPFLPVGADFDRDGRLYLLERSFGPLGFRSRIRRFDLTAPQLGETTLMTSWPSQYDNLEALSVWYDAAGRTRLTLISDDNFLSIQQTQIVEFTVKE